MKKRIIYVAILSAMICATILSGCNNTEVTSNETEPATTTSAVITTVAPTTKATETTVAPTTENETTVAETDVATEPQDTETQTEAPKIETEKPETNKPSSNTNSGGNTTSSQKPAQDTNNNTSNDNKPSNNNSQTVTDDTPIPHSQLCTDANMDKITSAVNTYFVNLGMTHNPSLNKDNSGWFLTQTNLVAYSECSVNNFMNDTIVSFNNEADAFGSMYGVTYSDWTFNCYAEKQANGEYNIYFCHE